MQLIKKQAMDGVNETVQTIRAAQQQHPDQAHFVTLVSFNSSEVKTIYDRVEANRVEELTDKQYAPTCGTPLYDAMGNALTGLQKSVAADDTVLVTVITDGEENASREYSAKAIKALVEDLKQQGWVFTYIGANQDVEEVAARLAVTNTLSFDTTAEGTQAMFQRERTSRVRFFDRLSACQTPEDRENLSDHYFEEK
jgi:hypothetical protein